MNMLAPLKNLKSEQIGGYVSLAGSSLMFLALEPASVVGAFLFTAAEITFARAGNTRWGYSLGAAGFALGDAALALSPTLASNPNVKMALFGMAATWAVGIVRAPLAALAERTSNVSVSKTLMRVSDGIQPVVGSLTLLQRLPGIYSAFSGGSNLVGTAMSLWGVSDVLTGRVQDMARNARSYISRKMYGASAPTGPA